MGAPILCEVLRSGYPASLHRGHVAVADAEGNLLFSSGNPNFRTYARSVLKPLQLIAVVESGAADAFSFTDEELAVMAGSHSGSSRHTEVVSHILSKIGLDENALECGMHHPMDAEEGKLVHRGARGLSKLHNNCSGKHAGMLAICRHMGWEHKNYVSPSHPVQELVLNTVGAAMRIGAFRDMTLGVDGCGVPTPYVELKSLAVGFAVLASGSNHSDAPRSESLRRISQAMASHPFMVAGKDRLCTAIMTALGGEVVSKGGGEAVYCVASRDRGVGVCVKIEDGTPRAVGPAVIETMRQVGWVNEKHLEELSEFFRPPVKNHREEVVGEIRACLQLETHSRGVERSAGAT